MHTYYKKENVPLFRLNWGEILAIGLWETIWDIRNYKIEDCLLGTEFCVIEEIAQQDL